MSWQIAKQIAEGIYQTLRAAHSHAFVGMILSALQRLHKAEERAEKATPAPSAHDPAP